jgi:hypothetical protein
MILDCNGELDKVIGMRQCAVSPARGNNMAMRKSLFIGETLNRQQRRQLAKLNKKGRK